MKILAYNINGQPVTNDYTWSNTINGKPAIKIATDVDNEYTDITSVKNWIIYGENNYDYIFVRDQLKILSTGNTFWTLNNDEKEIILKYCANEPTNLVGYIMSRDSLNQSLAYDKYLDYRCIDIRNAADSFKLRLSSSSFTKILIKYLGQSGAEVFLDACRNFIADMTDSALIGTEYGNSRDGLLDYINSTGSYLNSGLKLYTIVNGLTLGNFVIDLKNIIIKGIY